MNRETVILHLLNFKLLFAQRRRVDVVILNIIIIINLSAIFPGSKVCNVHVSLKFAEVVCEWRPNMLYEIPLKTSISFPLAPVRDKRRN